MTRWGWVTWTAGLLAVAGSAGWLVDLDEPVDGVDRLGAAMADWVLLAALLAGSAVASPLPGRAGSTRRRSCAPT